MEEPTYHLAGVMHTRDELPADFDGPLSVILLLLSKNKIEIQDVSITSILEQYLAYLDEMKRLDMEIASEFIAMASHLMLIKTKMLLSAAEREEAMSEMELLIRSLEEKQRAEAYEQIRTAVAFLEPRSDIGNGFFPHAPQPLRPDATYRYRHEPQDLLRAMAAMAERSERRLPPKLSNFQGIVGLEPYPVTKKAAQVLKQLLMRGVEKFCALFRGSRAAGLALAGFDGQKPVLLMTGGSLGAQSVNRCLREALPELLTRFDVLHLCGKGNLDESLMGMKGYCQKEFLSDEMPDALAVADVVLSRAGSNTLSELLALHKPMLLVPYPLGASRGDQIENAKSYARQGLARVLMQEDMTARTLTDALFKLLDERAELLAALEAYPVKDGTQAVLELIEDARKK